MGLPVTINIVVPDLPDSDIAFANAAAWNNYWADVTGEAEIEPADTSASQYVPAPFDNNLNYENFNVDGVDHVVCSKVQLDSLKAQVAALDANYQALKHALVTAGIITDY